MSWAPGSRVARASDSACVFAPYTGQCIGEDLPGHDRRRIEGHGLLRQWECRGGVSVPDQLGGEFHTRECGCLVHVKVAAIYKDGAIDGFRRLHTAEGVEWAE